MSINRRRNRGKGKWAGSFEALEPRQLLAALVNGSWQTEMVQWMNGTMEAVKDSYLITFDQRYGQADAMQKAAQVAQALGVPVEAGTIESLGRGRWARFSTPVNLSLTDAQRAMHQLGFVQWIEPEGIYHTDLVPNDARFAEQWGHLNTGQVISGVQGVSGADIDATLGWDLQTGSRQTIVAILDTGHDLLHPDLRDNTWVNPREIPGNNADDDGNGFVDDVNGYDFSGGNDNNPQAAVGNDHGVAVAGTTGAVGNNGVGVAGVAWQVTMIPVKIFPDNPGGAATGDIVEAIDYVTQLRTDFNTNVIAINASFGAVRDDDPNFFDDAQEIAIRAYTDSGGLFVAAAGNDTLNIDGPQFAYPAAYPNDYIISVAATNNQDGLADFSNYGATNVDLGAPGVQVLTTEVGGGYQFIDGTSFAAPYTTGVVALLASASPFATQSQLRSALLNGAEPIPALAGRTVTGGRLNANNSLRLVGFPGPIVTDISPSVESGPVEVITIGFSKPIDPSFFSVAGIELRAANNDNDFNNNDIFFAFAPSDVTITGSLMQIRLTSGALALDTYRLKLFAPFFRDFEGNYLNGTTAGGNDETYGFRIIAGGGPLEPNDTISQATPVIFGGGGVTFDNINIGDGNNPDRDVDMYRITMTGPGLITAQVDARSLPGSSDLDSYLRLFDASGRELARNDNFNGLDSRVQYFVPAGGRYYIGVSGFGNQGYLPGQQASGSPGASAGAYNISFAVAATVPETVDYGNTVPVNIPTTGTIASTIFIPDIRKVKDVNVTVNLAHSYVGDLQVRLISPGGTVIPLVLNRGGSSNLGIHTTFDDEANLSVTAGLPPWTGSFQPEGLLFDPAQGLASIDNESAYGTWTLQVTDNRALNGGTLQNWSLELLLENSIAGPFEFNDTLLTATDTGIISPTTKVFDAAVGDGAYGQLDVDLFRFIAPAGTTVTATVSLPAFGPNGAPNLLNSVLRLFDQQGNQLLVDARVDANTAQITFPVQFAGTFYLGVSGGANTQYDPTIGASGVASSASGNYSLQILVVGGITTGSLVLKGDNLTVGLAGDGAIGPALGQAVGVSLGSTEFIVPADSPATTESFYGATFDGFLFRNAGIDSLLPVTLANESDFSNRRGAAEGLFRSPIPAPDQGGGLLVRRAVSFGITDSFLVVDVSLTNTTFETMDSVSWVEGFRSQIAKNLGSPFTRTINNVQNATNRLATSTYFGSLDFPGGATIGIGAPAPASGQNVFLSVETPNTVRDPSQVIGSTVDPDPSGGDTGVEGDGTLTIAYGLGSLGAGATTRFRYFIFAGDSLAAVQQTFATLENDAGTGHLVENPNDPTLPASNLPYALYYPEGYANSRISEFVPLVNPHDDPARVIITARYEDPNLQPTVLFDGTLDPNARGGITVTTPALYAANTLLVRKDTPYALEVKSSLPIGATLSHYDFGIATGQAFTSQPSTVWTFSEGFKGGGVNDFLVFYNTANRTVKVDLTVYQEGSSQTFRSTQEVGAFKRGGWNLALTGFIPQGPFAMKLDAEAPIVAALTHFDGSLGGGFSILGVPDTGSTTGVSPEGQVGQNAATEFVTILNSGAAPATVTFSFFFENQSAYRRTITVEARQRSGFNVAQLPGFPNSAQPYSIGYESDQPLTVSLSSFAFGSGTGTRFSDTASTVWLFSDGFKPATGTAVTEYLRLFNPTTDNVGVEITLDFAPISAEGNLPAIPAGSVTFRKTINGRAANDFNIHDFVTGDRLGRNAFYSLTVKAPSPVVAYSGHFDEFFGSGFGTLGTYLGSESAALI